MKPTKLFIAAGVMSILCACTGVPAPQSLPAVDAQASDHVFAVATLASFGSFEFEAAPAFTRLAAFRHRSAALARIGDIGIATLERAISDSDRARALLDKALAADRAHDSLQAHQFLGDAIAIINSAEVALNAGAKQ